MSRFHFWSDTAYRYGLYVFYRDQIGGGDVEIAVAKESLARGVVHRFLAVGKGVIQSHALVVDAQVAAMDAAFRPVHTTTFGSVAIVQQFGGQTTESCTLLGFKTERGNRCAVLSEVDDEVLALIDNHSLAVFIFAVDDNFTVCIVS